VCVRERASERETARERGRGRARVWGIRRRSTARLDAAHAMFQQSVIMLVLGTEILVEQLQHDHKLREFPMGYRPHGIP